MNGEIAIVNILKADSGVDAICANRIYILEAPQGALFPYIIIEPSDNEPFPTKDGSSAVDHNSINVFSYGDSYKDAFTLANAVREALDGQSGTFNSVVVADIVYRGETGFNEEIENKKIYAKDQDYLVRVKL
jgi:hypothetical protein